MNLGATLSSFSSQSITQSGKWEVRTISGNLDTIFVDGNAVSISGALSQVTTNYNAIVTFQKNNANQQLNHSGIIRFIWRTDPTANCPSDSAVLDVLVGDTYIEDNSSNDTCFYTIRYREPSNFANNTTEIYYNANAALFSSRTHVVHESSCTFPTQTVFDSNAAASYPIEKQSRQGAIWRGFFLDPAANYFQGSISNNDGASVEKIVIFSSTAGSRTVYLTPTDSNYSTSVQSGPAGNVNPAFLYYNTSLGMGGWANFLVKAIINGLSAQGLSIKEPQSNDTGNAYNQVFASDNAGICFNNNVPSPGGNIAFLYRHLPNVEWLAPSSASRVFIHNDQAARDAGLTTPLPPDFLVTYPLLKTHSIDRACNGPTSNTIFTTPFRNANGQAVFPDIPDTTQPTLWEARTGEALPAGGSVTYNCTFLNVDLDGNINPAPGTTLGNQTHCSNATYSWTGPNGFTANTKQITNTDPGTYTLTVTCPECTYTQEHIIT